MPYQTTQKQAIYDWVLKQKHHPSAQDVFHGVKKALPQISFATVYRNLDALAQEGKIGRTEFLDQVKRYEANVKPHQHFICKRCKRIVDMELAELLNVKEVTKQIRCHEISAFHLELIGICSTCKK